MWYALSVLLLLLLLVAYDAYAHVTDVDVYTILLHTGELRYELNMCWTWTE